MHTPDSKACSYVHCYYLDCHYPVDLFFSGIFRIAGIFDQQKRKQMIVTGPWFRIIFFTARLTAAMHQYC